MSSWIILINLIFYLKNVHDERFKIKWRNKKKKILFLASVNVYLRDVTFYK